MLPFWPGYSLPGSHQVSAASLLASTAWVEIFWGTPGVEVSINGGTPIAEWFIVENPNLKRICLKIGYIPNEIAIFHRDNDQQNHWVQWGTLFSDTPKWGYPNSWMIKKVENPNLKRMMTGGTHFRKRPHDRLNKMTQEKRPYQAARHFSYRLSLFFIAFPPFETSVTRLARAYIYIYIYSTYGFT